MPHQLLINYLKEKVPIDQEDENFLRQTFDVKHFKKKEIIADKGEVSKYLYFLVSGITRSFYVNNKGAEVTRLITNKNRFFTNFLSFNKNLPSNEIIESIEDSQVLYINREKFYKILEEVPLTKQVFTLVLEDSYTQHLERIEVLSCFSPKERFLHLLNQDKELLYSLPNKVLASYLGITQETCSRLKKEVYQ